MYFRDAAPAALTFLSVALSLQKVGHPCFKHVPGPTKEAKSRISTILAAFKCIIDVTITWLVKS